MSDEGRISPYHIITILIRQAMRIKNYKFKDFFVDPVPNSQKQHHKRCMTVSQENYK